MAEPFLISERPIYLVKADKMSSEWHAFVACLLAMSLQDEYFSLLIGAGQLLLGIYYVPGTVPIALQILTLLIHRKGIRQRHSS